MAIRFTERLGSSSADSLIGSTGSIAFGLVGNDSLTSNAGSAYSVLVGGSGDDTYFTRPGTTITIGDMGGGTDTLVTSTLSPSANLRMALVDGRHFATYDVDSGESLIILDFLQERGSIENIRTPEGTFSAAQLLTFAQSQPSFVGNIAWEGLSAFGITHPYSTAETNEAISFYTDRARSLEVPLSPGEEGAVYRFFDADNGTHFYTASVAERNDIIRDLPAYRYEGKAFETADATSPDSIDVFRFFNSETGTHFYTASVDERDDLIDLGGVYLYEGEAYQAYDEAGAGRAALHRFYNTETGTHFYTASETEQDSLEANPGQYRYEGVGYFVEI